MYNEVDLSTIQNEKEQLQNETLKPVWGTQGPLHIRSTIIAQLVEYLEQYASYIVVALLPEDASALDDDYQRIAEI